MSITDAPAQVRIREPVPIRRWNHSTKPLLWLAQLVEPGGIGGGIRDNVFAVNDHRCRTPGSNGIRWIVQHISGNQIKASRGGGPLQQHAARIEWLDVQSRYAAKREI